MLGSPVSSVLKTNLPEAWKGVLQSLPADLTDVHYLPEYHQIYEANGDGEARLFCYREHGHVYVYPFMQGIIPSENSENKYSDITSAYGYSGPLASTSDAGFLAAADSAFSSYCRNEGIVTEFVRFHPLFQNQRFVPAGSGMEVIHLRDYLAVTLAASEEAQFSSYSSTNRNMIRKAVKGGVSVIHDRGFEHYGSFVDIYLDNMRQLQAAPMYFFSAAFFDSLKEFLRDNGSLLVAVKDNECVGAALFLHQGDYAHYFLASATPEGKRMAAGNLLLHEGVNLARRLGCRQLHLGGGVTAAQDDPLLMFKRNFTDKVVRYHIGKRIHDPSAYGQLISAWEASHPALVKSYGSLLQRYRITEKEH